MNVLELRNVTKCFGARTVLRSLSFSLAEKSRCLLVGDNGAGKTTFLRIAAGISYPDRGEVLFRGAQLRRADRTKIGFLSDESLLYPSLSIRENARLRGIPADAFERFSLPLHQSVGSLSSGQRKRLAIACTILPEPEVLFLDEPLTALDESSRDTLRELLSEFPGSVLVTSHEKEFFLAQGYSMSTLVGGVLR